VPVSALLLLGACQGPTRPEVVVLYSRQTPQMVSALPADRIALQAIEDVRPTGKRVATVSLAGHSLPPMYLGLPARQVATAIASYRPELVVLDTCYGASTPLLQALADTGLRCWVVAPPYKLPETGFVFAPGFVDEPDPARRATMVGTAPIHPLLRWRLDAGRLADIRRQVDWMPAHDLQRHIQRVQPTLIRMALPTDLAPDGRVLVPVPVRRFD
jgi:hypothetical protein